jgi:hypothetical protein
MALPGLVAAKNLADVADRERAWDNLGQGFTATFDTLPLALAPGTPLGGGFFAGYISHTADGNPTHALIVAPRATGATGQTYTLSTPLQNKTANLTAPGTASDYDGAANTAAMVSLGISDFPAAQFCVGLAIGGYSDWYLPAALELEIAYFNLKPGATANVTTSGSNSYAIPIRSLNYTASYPGQTSLTAFSTSTEAFAASAHWSSTEKTATSSVSFNFDNGTQANTAQINNLRVRAFRRIAL